MIDISCYMFTKKAEPKYSQDFSPNFQFIRKIGD